MQNEEVANVKDVVREEVEIAFLRVRYWLVVTVLANLITVGGPVLFAGVVQYNEMRETSKLAESNKARLDSRTSFIAGTELRIIRIEEFLNEQHGYKPGAPPPQYK